MRTDRAQAVYETTLAQCQRQVAAHTQRRLSEALADHALAPTDPITRAVLDACIEHAQQTIYDLPADSMFRPDYVAVIQAAERAGI
jgi:hypothetical protein